MIATLIILAVILITVAQFYLRNPVVASFAAVICVIFSLIISFNFYEPLADILITRGYIIQWAQPLCLALLFLIGFAVLMSLADYMLDPKISFGSPVKIVSSVVFGGLTGIIISGVLLVVAAISPMSATISYNRFGKGVSHPDIQRPNKATLNADGFTAGLFGWISKGSLSSGKSFDVFHCDYLNQVHLNRINIDKSPVVCSRDALKLPIKGTKPVRRREIDGKGLTIVRAGIANRKVSEGGAKGTDGVLAFSLSQIRLICKQKGQEGTFNGSAEAVYPIGIFRNNQVVKIELDEAILADKELSRGGDLWYDFVFDVPSGMAVVLLELRNNAVVSLPESVLSTDEIEQALNSPQAERSESEKSPVREQSEEQ